MKVLFLDIDGVLNDNNWIVGRDDQVTSDNTLGFMLKSRVDLLNKLCEEVRDLKIVISSSWRFRDSTLLLLYKAGFRYPTRIIGQTPRNNKHLRGEQIKEYIDTTVNYIEFVIFEDEPYDITGERASKEIRDFFKPHLIHTDFNIGLTIKDINKAIEEFKNDKPI
jgi:hypothetical protein